MIYTIEAIKNSVKPIVEKYQISAMYLYGSYARGEADDESDVDICLSVGGITRPWAFGNAEFKT